MTSDLAKTKQWAHQANIDRYRKLLKTYLTDNERDFVERRLDEEKKALREVSGGFPLMEAGFHSLTNAQAK